MFISHGLIAEA